MGIFDGAEKAMNDRKAKAVADQEYHHGKMREATQIFADSFSQKLLAKHGRHAYRSQRMIVRSVWKIDPGKTTPRLITAYPI